jgi:hypothetical protein
MSNHSFPKGSWWTWYNIMKCIHKLIFIPAPRQRLKTWWSHSIQPKWMMEKRWKHLSKIRRTHLLLALVGC